MNVLRRTRVSLCKTILTVRYFNFIKPINPNKIAERHKITIICGTLINRDFTDKL